MRKIEIFNTNQYTKKGRLKKNAIHEMGLTIVDIGDENTNENHKYIAKTIKQRGYHNFTSPYIFTHIDALNDKNERVLIFESVVIGSDNREICTTPKKVFELLTNNK